MGSLSRGLCLEGLYLKRGVSVQGAGVSSKEEVSVCVVSVLVVSVWGSLSRESLSGGLSLGVSVQGSLSRGVSV